MGKKYINHNGLEVTFGNTKLGDDTLIFNMGPAKNCPSKAKGLCKLGDRCYALKAERLYKEVYPYRARQCEYWSNHSADEITEDLWFILMNKKVKLNGKLVRLYKKVKYFRYNEAGDFWGQLCVAKLSTIARRLKRDFGIIAYGYSARSDLDFSTVRFNVKGSGHDKGNNGRTIVRKMSKADREEVKEYWKAGHSMPRVEKGEVYHICPMDCKVCDMCKTHNNLNICFPLH